MNPDVVGALLVIGLAGLFLYVVKQFKEFDEKPIEVERDNK